MSTIIEVSGIGKQYRLGQIGTGTISHDLNRWWSRLRGKEDPYLKIGDENDRTRKGNVDYAWALKDINFDVQKGEVLGIIGRNGAGKSTLLKVLSRTTAPTTGKIKIKGRVASLLEVGTGFHPDLTGSENIYLNGAILGMSKIEIKNKFDEIVTFAGVERYTDTPVKRYSSGMYVRLAFAIAAHLEPEILIVDEVLAVGDAEFQKKCLGKMKDVSVNEGRTILFVSHNMTAIKNLCNSVIYLRNGRMVEKGQTKSVINNYLSDYVNGEMLVEFENPDKAPGNDLVRVKKLEICPPLNLENEIISMEHEIDIIFEFWNYIDAGMINISLGIYTIADEHICQVVSNAKILSIGIHKSICKIPGRFFNDGVYKINILVVQDKSKVVVEFDGNLSFEIHEAREASGWHGKWPGLVRPKFDFNLL